MKFAYLILSFGAVWAIKKCWGDAAMMMSPTTLFCTFLSVNMNIVARFRLCPFFFDSPFADNVDEILSGIPIPRTLALISRKLHATNNKNKWKIQANSPLPSTHPCNVMKKSNFLLIQQQFFPKKRKKLQFTLIHLDESGMCRQSEMPRNQQCQKITIAGWNQKWKNPWKNSKQRERKNDMRNSWGANAYFMTEHQTMRLRRDVLCFVVISYKFQICICLTSLSFLSLAALPHIWSQASSVSTNFPFSFLTCRLSSLSTPTTFYFNDKTFLGYLYFATQCNFSAVFLSPSLHIADRKE